MKRSLSRALSATLCAALAVSGVPAAAQGQAPSDLTDLLGARGRDGEFQMESRGYNLHHSAQSANSVYGYWWNTGSKKCVRVRTEDGRYQQIDTVGSPDCGQQNAQGMSDGAKIAIGAAALLGIAALAHKSHHRDDQSYDERQTADFERGFRDGKYNHHFSNYSNSQEYAKGYGRGVEERDNQSSYRPEYRNYQRSSDRSGNWTQCAAEGSTCRVPYRTTVRFGADGRYNMKNVSGRIACTPDEFGDPIRGVRKTCEYDSN